MSPALGAGLMAFETRYSSKNAYDDPSPNPDPEVVVMVVVVVDTLPKKSIVCPR